MSKYCYRLILLRNNTYDTRSTDSIGTYYCRTNGLRQSFFLYTSWKRNKLDWQLCNIESFKKFRNRLLELAILTPDIIYGVPHPLGPKLLTRLTLGLSKFNDYRLKHNFQNCINSHILSKSRQLSIFSALPLLFSTLHFSLKWFKQHFTIIHAISWRGIY